MRRAGKKNAAFVLLAANAVELCDELKYFFLIIEHRA
jgi:hypothetical protein